ncbi:MAG TPA: YIP1 family protein, partial [Thermoanaerobaculia bacterium]|nr:YIP1 family protein [Thermoanaerobaculia bacterium]
IDVFYAPSKVFARREKSGFWMHLVVIAVLTALFAFASRAVFSQIFDAEFARGTAKAMAENPRLTPEMMDRMKPIQEKVAQVVIYAITPIIILFTALLVWLVSKAVSAKLTYTQAAMIVCIAWVPRLVGGLLGAIQVLIMDTSNVTNMFGLGFSPARFMNPDTMNLKLFTFLGAFDVFSLWYAVLIGIGVAVMGKVPRSKGFIVTAVVFLIATLPTLFGR